MGHLVPHQYTAFLNLVLLFLLVPVMPFPIAVPFLVFRLGPFPFTAARSQSRAVTSVAPFV